MIQSRPNMKERIKLGDPKEPTAKDLADLGQEIAKMPSVGDLSGLKDLGDDVIIYCKSIPDLPFNTLEQDLEIGKKLFELRNLPPNEETKELLKETEEKLILPCLRFVVSRAKVYFRPEIDLLDLIQSGNEGLIKAV